MRILFSRLSLVLIVLVGGIFGAQAQSNLKERGLDQLFALLAHAPNAAEAARIADEIWVRWTQPTDPEIAVDMAEALSFRRELRLNAAMNALTEMTRDYPDYAEAWNQRATIHFLLGNFDESLADIKEVLKREPRHFGALTGRAIILLQKGDEQGALDAITAALKIHPFLPERGLFPQLVEPMIRT